MKFEVSPRFFREALDQEKSVRKGLPKLIQFVDQLSFSELMAHKGVHLEKLHSLTYPETGEALHSMRVTISVRAICIVREDRILLLSVQTDHDKAYRQN